MKQYSISERLACRLMRLPRSTKRYAPRVRADEATMRKRLVELAAERPSFGYRRLGALLRREGNHVNDKRVHRLYRAEGLSLRRKRRKRLRRSAAPANKEESALVDGLRLRRRGRQTLVPSVHLG
jgi:putative transposase